MKELTPEETKAIRALKKAVKNLPKGLWLFAATGLHVMRCDDDGSHAMTDSNSIDPNYEVDHMPCDISGGDW